MVIFKKPPPPPSREPSRIKPTPSPNVTPSQCEPTLRVICSPRVKPATHLSRVVANILAGRPCNDPLPFEGVYADKLGLCTFKNTFHGDKEFKDYTHKKYGPFRKRELFFNKRAKPKKTVSECEIDPCSWAGTDCKKHHLPSLKDIGPGSITNLRVGRYGTLAYGSRSTHDIHRDRKWSPLKKSLLVEKKFHDFTEVKRSKTLKGVTAFPSQDKLFKKEGQYSVFSVNTVSLDGSGDTDEVPVHPVHPVHRDIKPPQRKPVKAKGGEEKVLGLGLVPREETIEITRSTRVINVKPEPIQKSETKNIVSVIDDNRQLQRSESKPTITIRAKGGVEGGKVVVGGGERESDGEDRVGDGGGGGKVENVVERGGAVGRVEVGGKGGDVGERGVGRRPDGGGKIVNRGGGGRQRDNAYTGGGNRGGEIREIREKSDRVAPSHASGKPAGYPHIKGQTKSHTDIKRERVVPAGRPRSASVHSIPKRKQYEKKQFQSRGTFSFHYGRGLKSHRKLPLKKKYDRKFTGIRKRNEWAGEDCEEDYKRRSQHNNRGDGGGDDEFCYKESQELMIINQCLGMPSNILKMPSKTLTLPPAENFMLYLEKKFPKSKWGRGTPIATRNYPNGSVFVAQYPNGGSRVYYPHGGLAVAISGPSPVTSQILLVRDPSDNVFSFDKALLADLNSSGKGMIYGDDGATKAQYSTIGGFKFDDGFEKGHRWHWNQGGQRIIMKLNKSMSLRISDLDKIFLNFHGNTRGFLVNVATGMKVTLMTLERPIDPVLHELRSLIRPKTSDQTDYFRGKFLPRPTLGFVDKFRCESRDFSDVGDNQAISFNNLSVKKPYGYDDCFQMNRSYCDKLFNTVSSSKCSSASARPICGLKPIMCI